MSAARRKRKPVEAEEKKKKNADDAIYAGLQKGTDQSAGAGT